MDYNQIRFFILNNKENLTKDEIKTQLLKNGASNAEVDLLLNKFYSNDYDLKSRILFSFLFLILIGFIIGFYSGLFNSILHNQNQYINKVSGDFNSGLLPIELGVYGGENGAIDSRFNDYFSFKFKFKKGYKPININNLTLRIISRDRAIDYKLNPDKNNIYPFDIKSVLGNIDDLTIDPGDIFIIKFKSKVDIFEDETFNLLFLKNNEVFDVITIATPKVMKTNYVILKSVY